jgi:TRAP-type C4-dicarboxylate transport system permease small subunit
MFLAKLLKVFERIDSALSKIIRAVVVLLSLFVACAMVLGILMRSALNAPMLGLEEIILFGVMWLYMMGAALASRDRSHLSADFVAVVVNNLNVRNALHLFATLVSLAMVMAFVVWSFDLLAWGLSKQQSTPIFQLPVYLSQGSLFCASLLFLFYMLRDVVHDLDQLAGGRG